MRAETCESVSQGYSDPRDELSREHVLCFITSPRGKAIPRGLGFG